VQPVCNSKTALGLRALTVENRVRSRCTSKERDSETGLDYFGARYYSNGLGRFITPDWAAKPAAVPYAVLGDPQSLNLYSYVRNLPTTTFDADGHCGSDGPCSNITVTVNPAKGESDPHPMENEHFKGVQNGQPVDVYKSGVGLHVDVTFSDSNGPISGMKVTESNSSGPGTLVQNQQPGTTNDKGQITDVVMRGVTSDPKPLNITDKSSEAAPSHQELIDHVNSTPYNSTQTQTLTFSTTDSKGQPCTCQATYDRTLSNTDSKGNLNTQTNSQGVNYKFSHTDPVVKPQQ
jgi:RHS repeat-associated protein